MKNLWMIALFALQVSAQDRIVAHVTPNEGDFTTHYFLINPTEESLPYTLTPYTGEGQALTQVTGELQPMATRYVSNVSLFNGEAVTHFGITAPNLLLTLAYRDRGEAGSSAHVNPSGAVSQRWRLQPGELGDVVDGVAVVNAGDEAATVWVRQMAQDGTEKDRLDVFELAANAKSLYVFQDFQAEEGDYFEIFADVALGLAALRFPTDGASYFWQTAATALPAISTDTNSAPTITGQVPLEMEAGQSLTLTLDHVSAQDPDGDPLALVVSNGADYARDGNTITPNDGFSGTLTVPVYVTDGQASSSTYDLAVTVTAAAHPAIGKRVVFPNNPTYGVSGSAVIVDERTIRLENFNYDGSGPDVRVYIGNDPDYANGVAISNQLTRQTNATLEFTIPQRLSLDDFDGISIWCTLFSVDFASGVFQ